MQKILLVILMIGLSCQIYARCGSEGTPAAMMNCYTNEYIEAEAELNNLVKLARKVIDKHDVRQLQTTIGIWTQYMTAQCELESRMFRNNPGLRPTSIAMCRTKMIKQFTTSSAQLVKKLATAQASNNKKN